jgi:hypothetical protein
VSSKAVRNIVALLLVAFAVFGTPSLPLPSPDVVVKEPSVEMKTQVRQVTKVASQMSAIDRMWLNYIYINAAKVVEADGLDSVITTTEGLRAVHVGILKFIWKGMAGNPPEKYEGLRSAIEQVFVSTMGDDRRTLTPDLRRKACEMFDAIAWAGLGKDE